MPSYLMWVIKSFSCSVTFFSHLLNVDFLLGRGLRFVGLGLGLEFKNLCGVGGVTC